MTRYMLYNDDVQVAVFFVRNSVIRDFRPQTPELLPMQIQPFASTEAEVEISRVLRSIGWDAAEYAYAGRYRKRVRTRSFLHPRDFFEPYDSFRFLFDDPSDDDQTVYRNLCSLGMKQADAQDRANLAELRKGLEAQPYLKKAYDASLAYN